MSYRVSGSITLESEEEAISLCEWLKQDYPDSISSYSEEVYINLDELDEYVDDWSRELCISVWKFVGGHREVSLSWWWSERSPDGSMSTDETDFEEWMPSALEQLAETAE